MMPRAVHDVHTLNEMARHHLQQTGCGGSTGNTFIKTSHPKAMTLDAWILKKQPFFARKGDSDSLSKE